MSNDIMPSSNDTISPITPQISRFPNPVPASHAGFISGVLPREQSDQEQLSEEIARELDIPVQVAKPLPIFNR
jgi:hypothetical protein